MQMWKMCMKIIIHLHVACVDKSTAWIMMERFFFFQSDVRVCVSGVKV